MAGFETKSLILATLIKQDKPFKVARIGNATGLDGNLIRYHLRALLDNGVLEKNGMYWSIVDRDALINAITELSDEPHIRRPEATKLVPKMEAVNKALEYAVALRELNHPVAPVLKLEMLKEIDNTIHELKNARKYITRASMNERKARKRTEDIDEVWQYLKVFLAQYTNSVEFEEGFSEPKNLLDE